MSPAPELRTATEADAAAVLSIYRPYVETTAITFETTPPTVDDIAGRIRKALAAWTWLMAEVEGVTAGYAYGSLFRERAAYRYTVETTVYVRQGYHRRGIGRHLYARLLAVLTDLGYRTAVAGITLPNESSVALHRQAGFEPVGVLRRVGWKHGAWRDVGWYQRTLSEAPPVEST